MRIQPQSDCDVSSIICHAGDSWYIEGLDVQLVFIMHVCSSANAYITYVTFFGEYDFLKLKTEQTC